MADKTLLPRIGLTMGDVAGIGPEVIARVLSDKSTFQICQPIVIGNSSILHRALELVCKAPDTIPTIQELSSLAQANEYLANSDEVLCFDPVSELDLSTVVDGQLDALSGDAAYHYLISAIEAAQQGEIDGITTAPLNKAALHLAGHHYPAS